MEWVSEDPKDIGVLHISSDSKDLCLACLLGPGCEFAAAGWCEAAVCPWEVLVRTGEDSRCRRCLWSCPSSHTASSRLSGYEEPVCPQRDQSLSSPLPGSLYYGAENIIADKVAKIRSAHVPFNHNFTSFFPAVSVSFRETKKCETQIRVLYLQQLNYHSQTR